MKQMQLMNSPETLLREYIPLSHAVTANVESTLAMRGVVYEASERQLPQAAARAVASHPARRLSARRPTWQPKRPDRGLPAILAQLSGKAFL